MKQSMARRDYACYETSKTSRLHDLLLVTGKIVLPCIFYAMLPEVANAVDGTVRVGYHWLCTQDEQTNHAKAS